MTEKTSHLVFELTDCRPNDRVELAVWGPYHTTIKKVIGETVGVVQGESFAVGLQALNVKTLGGYPWTDNDCMPQIDIFEGEDYSDLSEQGKRHVLYRVEAAKPTKTRELDPGLLPQQIDRRESRKTGGRISTPFPHLTTGASSVPVSPSSAAL